MLLLHIGQQPWHTLKTALNLPPAPLRQHRPQINEGASINVQFGKQLQTQDQTLRRKVPGLLGERPQQRNELLYIRIGEMGRQVRGGLKKLG